MRKSAAGTKRTSARAGTGTTTASRTRTAGKAKTAATTPGPKRAARATTAATTRTTTARSKASTTAKAGKMETTSNRRGQSVRAREVGGTPWSELKQNLLTAFENAFADRKGQARGAAMRGPNRIIEALDTHIKAITRQTNNRQIQVLKLTEELNTLRAQPSSQTTQQGGDWTQGAERTERMAPDQIAGPATQEQPSTTNPEAEQQRLDQGGEITAGVTAGKRQRASRHAPAAVE